MYSNPESQTFLVGFRNIVYPICICVPYIAYCISICTYAYGYGICYIYITYMAISMCICAYRNTICNIGKTYAYGDIQYCENQQRKVWDSLLEYILARNCAFAFPSTSSTECMASPPAAAVPAVHMQQCHQHQQQQCHQHQQRQQDSHCPRTKWPRFG